MKKNKNSRHRIKKIKERIGRYRIGMVIINLISFFFVFIMMGVVALISITARSFYSARERIIEHVGSIGSNNFDERQFQKSPDIRLTIAYYFSDLPSVGGLPFPSQPDLRIVVGDLGEDNVPVINKIKAEKLNTFNQEELHGHTYLTYTCRPSYAEYRIDNENKVLIYVKVYMNIDGEINSRKDFLITYFFCMLSILIFSVFASFALMNRSVKPLREFLNKQLTFVSDASHELRTPLAIVQSQLENILTDPERTIFDASEEIAIILKEISRLTKLTTDLLNLAKSDQEQILLNLETIDLNILLKDFIEPFVEIAELENRVLTYVGQTIEVKVDIDKIRQIMIIVLDNAMKYTNAGETISINLAEVEGEAMITIADTGIGITETTKQRIFERFYREDRARSRATGGNGLGLAIAKTLVTLQKGRIFVDHNEPKGTKVVIVFPKAKIGH